MFFFGLGVFFFSGLYLPWWTNLAVALAIGWLRTAKKGEAFGLAAGAALAWIAGAYIADAHGFGVISLRLAGLLGLPAPGLAFLLMGLFAAINTCLGFKTGQALKMLATLGFGAGASSRRGKLYRTRE